MTRRRKLDKPTPKMTDAAWRTLHSIVEDEAAPTHTRVTAARTIVVGVADDDEDEDVKGKAAPPKIVCLPSNGRNPDIEVIGISWDGPTVNVRYYPTPEGEADRDRWEAEVRTKIAEDFPPPLVLAPPKPKLTHAERKADYRRRLAAGLVKRRLPAPAVPLIEAEKPKIER